MLVLSSTAAHDAQTKQYVRDALVAGIGSGHGRQEGLRAPMVIVAAVPRPTHGRRCARMLYRQALELDLRGKREYTVAIYAAMGGLDKKRFSRFKALLRLCDEAFEMADRHNVDEARLRYTIQLEPPDQIEMMRQIIQFDLTRKQVKDLIEKGSNEAETTSENETISRPLMQLAKVMKTRDLPDPQSLATYLISQEQNVNLARARIQTLRELLDQAEQFMAD
jgi:hypothetical protein